MILLNNDICAIIVSYNCDKSIIDCINSIEKQVASIVIVDNGSASSSKEILEEIKKRGINIIYNEDNMGIAYALNQGVTYAKEKKYSWVLTLDQDSIATEAMISNMLNVYSSLDDSCKDKVVSIVPSHVEQSSYKETEFVNSSSSYEEILTDITSGNLVKLDVFDDIGYYNEKMFIDLVDHEFCLRLRSKGYVIIRVMNSVLLHNLGNTNVRKLFSKTVYSTNHSSVRRYYITRNRNYIWNKYKDFYPEWVKHDKKSALKDFIIILLYEKSKLEKVRMILKGYLDYKFDRYGKIRI